MKVRETKRVHLENSLGWKGWFYGGRYRLERYLYTLQRVTGLGLVLYTLLHLTMNGFRLGGERAWTGLMEQFHNPVIGGLEYLVLAGFIIHGINGLRLIFQHLGLLLPRPEAPVYPFRDSLQKRRGVLFGMLGIMAIFLIIALIDILL
jgi:succinate dehydrogenase / fumarate reductase cytochrome b subunit